MVLFSLIVKKLLKLPYLNTNVLEGIGLIEKKLKNRIHWNIAVGFYILLRAVDRFATNYNSFSGQFNGEMDEDISRLKTIAVSLLSDLGCNGSTLTEDLINEMCRYGAAELHVVAAFIGGIASQEVIKLDIILHQHWVLDCHPWLVLEQKLLPSMASARAKVTGVFWENLGFFCTYLGSSLILWIVWFILWFILWIEK